jgi:hypothetical protein
MNYYVGNLYTCILHTLDTAFQAALTGCGLLFPCLAASAPGAPSPAGLQGSGIGVDGSIGGFLTRPTREYRSWFAKKVFQCSSAYRKHEIIGAGLEKDSLSSLVDRNL